MEKAGNMPIGVFDSGLGGLTVARESLQYRDRARDR